jgi:hypothetical protein
MTWRRQLRAWINQVRMNSQWTGNVTQSAYECGASFPRTQVLAAVRVVSRDVAAWLLARFIRDEATALGWNLSDASASALATVAIDLL